MIRRGRGHGVRFEPASGPYSVGGRGEGETTPPRSYEGVAQQTPEERYEFLKQYFDESTPVPGDSDSDEDLLDAQQVKKEASAPKKEDEKNEVKGIREGLDIGDLAYDEDGNPMEPKKIVFEEHADIEGLGEDSGTAGVKAKGEAVPKPVGEGGPDF